MPPPAASGLGAAAWSLPAYAFSRALPVARRCGATRRPAVQLRVRERAPARCLALLSYLALPLPCRRPSPCPLPLGPPSRHTGATLPTPLRWARAVLGAAAITMHAKLMRRSPAGRSLTEVSAVQVCPAPVSTLRGRQVKSTVTSGLRVAQLQVEPARDSGFALDLAWRAARPIGGACTCSRRSAAWAAAASRPAASRQEGSSARCITYGPPVCALMRTVAVTTVAKTHAGHFSTADG